MKEVNKITTVFKFLPLNENIQPRVFNIEIYQDVKTQFLSLLQMFAQCPRQTFEVFFQIDWVVAKTRKQRPAHKNKIIIRIQSKTN